MKERAFSSRLNRHRGAGLIVSLLKEKGPMRWKDLHSYVCYALSVDDRKKPTRLLSGPEKSDGRGFYSSYYTNDSPYWGKRSSGSTHVYVLTKKGKQLYNFLQDRAAAGLDVQKHLPIRIWECKEGDVLVIKKHRCNTMMPIVSLKRRWGGGGDTSDVAFSLDYYDVRWPDIPIKFPLDPGDELIYVGVVPNDIESHILTLSNGQQCSIQGYNARGMLALKEQ